jgi:L-cysteine desulfidase
MISHVSRDIQFSIVAAGGSRSAAMNCSASSQAAWRAVLSNTHHVSIALALVTAAARVCHRASAHMCSLDADDRRTS